MTASFEIRQATIDDSELLRNLIRATPQDGELIINFEREPNFFHGTGVATSDPDVWIYFDRLKQQLAGVYSFGSRDVYVNGERQKVRYANDLRIHSDYHGSRSLIRMFRKAKTYLREQEWMQTVILSDNEASLSTISSGRAGLASYYPYGEITTHMLYTNGKKKPINTGITVRQAEPKDLDAMQTFFNREAPKKQFYPHYQFKDLLKPNSYYNNLSVEDYFIAFDGSELIGICGIWNQKKFKQTRVLEYRGKMRWLRSINNIYSKCFGGIQLPKAGGTLDYISLHTVLMKDNQVDIFRTLLRTIYNHFSNQSFSAIVTGLSSDDPLLTVCKDYRKQTLYSKHFLMSFGDDPRPQFDKDKQLYIEIARS